MFPTFLSAQQLVIKWKHNEDDDERVIESRIMLDQHSGLTNYHIQWYYEAYDWVTHTGTYNLEKNSYWRILFI